jgi:hypothetical protein
MNDQHLPLPPAYLRLIVVAALVIALLGGLDALITAVGLTALILYFAGWNLARTRAAARSLIRTIIGE